MARRLFTLLSALSLLLCVAAVGLWVRSLDDVDSVRWTSGDRGYGVNSGKGRLELAKFAYTSVPPPAGFEFGYWSFAPHHAREKYMFVPDRTPWTAHLGFGFGEGSGTLGRHSSPTGRDIKWDYWSVVMPWWAVVAATAVLPVLRVHAAVRFSHRRRRAARGLCPACGYDLRATPGRCPECGTAPATKQG